MSKAREEMASTTGRFDEFLSGAIGDDTKQRMEEFRRALALDTQLLTIFLSDLVSSTRQQAVLGNRSAAMATREQRRITRSLLQQFNGREVETAGDSLLAVFAKPSEGVAFSLKLQAEMRDARSRNPHLLPIRMGLSLGQIVVEQHASGKKPMDIYGNQVSIAARITSMARGGQILCDRAVFDNAKSNLGDENLSGVGKLKWLLHGSYRLKGEELPQEIGEVGEKKFAPFSRPVVHKEPRRLRWAFAGAAFAVAVMAVAWALLRAPAPAPVVPPASRAADASSADPARGGNIPAQSRLPESPQAEANARGSTEKSVRAAEVAEEARRDTHSAASLEGTLRALDYPGCMLLAKIDAEQPKIVKRDGDSVTVEWPLVITVDDDAYFSNVLPRLKEALSSAAKASAPTDMMVNGNGTEGSRLVGGFQEEGGRHKLPRNTAGVVVKKNLGGSNLCESVFTLDSEAFAALGKWLRSSQGGPGEIPRLRIAWLDKDGGTILEDELDLNHGSRGLDASPYLLQNGTQQGHFGWDMTGSIDDGLEIGPFLYTYTGMSFTYCGGLRCSYQRKVSPEDLARVVKMKCYFMERQNGGQPGK